MSYDSNMQSLYEYFPYAKKASERLGNLKAGVILAQWAHESAFFTSDVFRNANNAAGIKFVNGASIAATNYSAYAQYNSLDQFVDDYVRVMNLSYYADVRAAGTDDAAITALGASPYAEDPNYANAIRNIYNTYGMGAFDTYQGGGGGGSSSGGISLDNLSTDDLKKYAAIGIAAVGLIALIKG